MKLSLLIEQVTDPICSPNRPCKQQRRHDQNERRGPVFDLPEQVHAAVDDVDVQTPEQQKRQPFGGSVTSDWTTQQRLPSGDDGFEERVQCLTADPRLDTEPAAAA